MELQLGKMRTDDLAKWFGISSSTFRKTSKQRLEELKLYCEYEKYHGGVDITRIYNAEYVPAKTGKDIVQELVKEYWVREKYETGSNMSIKLAKIIKDLKLDVTISESTLKNYVNAFRRQYWGACRFNEPASGDIGRSKRKWAKKYYNEDGTAYFKPFTVEDRIKKSELAKRYFGINFEDDSDGAICEWANQELSGDEAMQEILHADSKEEVRAKIRCYLADLAELLGCEDIVQSTIVKDGFVTDENGNMIYDDFD